MTEVVKQFIPVHQMDTTHSSGIAFSYSELSSDHSEIIVNSKMNEVHRDDYYMFLFGETAFAKFTLDFEEIQWQGEFVFYIRPGQVHFVSSFEELKGWFLAINPVFVKGEYKEMFDKLSSIQQPVLLNPDSFKRLHNTACLLDLTMKARQTEFSNSIILNLANVFIGNIAELYALSGQLDRQMSKNRQSLIAYQFKSLLAKNIRTMKSPSQYAEMLNYSLSHLNESVKIVTGFPVSYWIHQQVVLEAKRLLYNTNIDIKEIAFSLGYEDYSYFS